MGCVTAACLARLGHHVVGVDKDDFKVRSVLDGHAPFYEPGLEELIRDTVASGHLTASTSLGSALEGTEVALIAVGTPSQKNGNLAIDQLRRVAEQIGCEHRAPLVVAVRSTVFPGTCEEVVIPAIANPDIQVVSNPEFLREGCAVRDFMEPSLVVVGGSDAGAKALVADIYRPLGVEPCIVSLRTAEMIKYACNAFHATKIGFANEIGSLCSRLGIDGLEVMDTLCRDNVLNASAAYLRPGFPFGGSCLPKDLRALVYRSSRLDLKFPLLESVLPGNQAHLDRAIQMAMELPAQRLGVFGLAFKENTDDLRESPVVTLLEHLIGKGRHVRVFDPHIRLDQIYGSNQRFVLAAIPHIGRLLDSDLVTMLEWSDHLILAQNPAPNYWEQIRRSKRPVLDLISGRTL